MLIRVHSGRFLTTFQSAFYWPIRLSRSKKMKLAAVLVSVVLCSSIVFSQKATREQKIQTILDLRSQMSVLEKEILQPDARDLEIAEKHGVAAIRIMPREKYSRVLTTNGGGAYYSFFRGTHEYGQGSDLSLEQGKFSVGFAGADYGLLRDLGEVNVLSLEKDSGGIGVLMRYVPPTDEPSIRAEYQKLGRDYEIDGFVFKSRVPAVVGHSFVLRSISLDRSDVLIAFSVLRKDEDGSLILLWRPIETFPKPEMRREKAVVIL
ncbi:MAG TPA: hypothetical protein VNA17_10855 [Pyrinomonadaceae bacterium]|nr:hypothetical protein [Pyrinomonadaceae bacterium]